MSTLEDYFKYHPPTTDQRIKDHALVNESALAFAKALETLNLDPVLFSKILDSIQMARMFANQAVTMKDLERDNKPKKYIIYSNREENFLEAVLLTGKRSEELPSWLYGEKLPTAACFACLDLWGDIKFLSLTRGYEIFDCAEKELEENGLMYQVEKSQKVTTD